MTRLILALAALLFGAPANAWIAQRNSPTEQVLLSHSIGAVSNSVDNFFRVGYTGSVASADGDYSLFATSGVMTEFRFFATVPPTGTQTWTGTLMKNGSATGLTCTIDSGSSGKCAATGTVAFAAGDYASIKSTPANSPTASRLSAAMVFKPTTPNYTLIFGRGAGFSTTVAKEQTLNVGTTVQDPSLRYSIFPDNGTVRNFYVHSNAPGAGTSYDYNVMHNGSASGVTAPIAGVATANNDTTHSFSVAANDDAAFQGVPNNTPAAATASFGIVFTPATYGRFPLIFDNLNASTATNYLTITGSQSAAAESSSQAISSSMTVEKIYVKLITSPGSGKSRVFVLRVNGVDSALTCTIADTATECNASGSVSVANDDILTTGNVASGSPATTAYGVAYLAHR